MWSIIWLTGVRVDVGQPGVHDWQTPKNRSWSHQNVRRDDWDTWGKPGL